MPICTDSNYIAFDSTNGVWQTQLKPKRYLSAANFDLLWQMHPNEFPRIFLHGREVNLPRWQQAYGADYFFSGRSSKAGPTPQILQKYLNWGRRVIDRRLNGLLLNWYDDQLGHYIGAHRDSTKGILSDTSIVMISLGGSRVMRFRPVKRSGFIDIPVDNGDVIILPLNTNANYKHEIPKLKRYRCKRISITMRCFTSEQD